MNSDDGTGMVIAQISDLHAGGGDFAPELLEAAVLEMNELGPDLVLVTGDLTNDGYRDEYRIAKEHIDRIECEKVLVIPGNHDSRNVGYVHFEDLFGQRDHVLDLSGTTLVALDSSAPDLDLGRVGRERYGWIRDAFSQSGDVRILALHHHILPIPRTGRERNIIEDAGDFLELVTELGVGLVLTGHKHVPHNWRFEDMYVLSAGTVSSTRLRGYARACYTIVELGEGVCTVYWKFPMGDRLEVAVYPVPPTPRMDLSL